MTYMYYMYYVVVHDDMMARRCGDNKNQSAASSGAHIHVLVPVLVCR